ncbi:hypothetical protein HDU79_004606 [Rhizoclosmatium sp. JEL0117]|nr:hypothetical protein HDU79_004606 [Rhizoclosmatium sp. JEL0117]
MGLLLTLLAILIAIIVGCIYAIVPSLLQVAVDQIGKEKQPRPPVFNKLAVESFAEDGVTVAVDLLLPLPFKLSLPNWFQAGLATAPSLNVYRQHRHHKENDHSNHPLLMLQLSEAPILPGGELDAIPVVQTINFVVEDREMLRRLIRRVHLQLTKDGKLDDIFLYIDTYVDVQIMGHLLWRGIHLHRTINLAPILDNLRNDPMFTESHKAKLVPPPAFIPDVLSLDSLNASNQSLTDSLDPSPRPTRPGPLHLYKVGLNLQKTNVDDSQVSRVGLEGLLPGLKLFRLPQTTTSQGTLRSGIRATFAAPPALHLSIQRIEFRVKLNGQFVASGAVDAFKVGPSELKTDLNVSITPSIVSGGASGLVRGAFDGAKGFLKGVLVGTLSGFNGGEFGDGSTVVEIVDLNIFAYTESGSVINVPFIREAVGAVDLVMDINPIKALSNGVDTSIVVEVAAGLLLKLLG